MLADSLADVRYDDSGCVIPESVNPMLLTLASGVISDAIERNALCVPLTDVQAEYASLLERFFRQPFAEMTKHGITPHDVAEDFASSKKRTQLVCNLAPDLHEALAEFWRGNGLTVIAHLRSQRALRAVYGGNLFPHFKSDFASNLTLYADTLVLPDPLISITGMAEMLKPERLTYLFMRHGLTAMGYKDLALADVAIPIIVFVPDQFWLADSVRQSLHALSLDDIRLHAERVFGRPFADIDAVRQYIGGFSNEREIADAVKDAGRFIFDADKNPLPLDQIACLMEDCDSLQDVAGLRDARHAVSSSLEGRFMQANEAVTQAGLYGGVPVIDAPTSWQYLLWKYEYATMNRDSSVDHRDLMIQHVIHEQLADMPGLTNVSQEAVIELRRRDMLAGLREAFRKGVGTVKNASSEAFDEVARQVSQNLRTAVSEYNDDIRSLAAKRGGLFGAIGLSSGGLALGLAAAVYGGIPLGVAGAIAAAAGQPTMTDLYKKLQEFTRARTSLAQNPVGLFLNAKGS